ncbi:unnamed protein product, partial [Rhizoctonia solani]
MVDSDNNKPFELICFVLGDNPADAIAIQVSSTTRIQAVLPDIIDCYNRQSNINGRRLDREKQRISFHQVDVAFEDLVDLAPPKNSILMKVKEVGYYWPDPQQIDGSHVHILIDPHEIAPLAQVDEETPLPTGPDEIANLIVRFQTTRLDFLNSLGKSNSSDAALHRNLKEQQEGRNYILIGRPLKHTGPPIVIFHPVFGKFLSNLQSSEPLSIKFYYQVQDYFWTSQDTYDVETEGKGTQRDPNVVSGLEDLLGKLWKTLEPGAAADGAAIIDTGGYSMIIEMKNEIGAGGSDPMIQAAQAYSRICRSSRLTNRCYSPSILIAIAGPWMCVLGAVFLNRPVVQPLTDLIWVGSNP